MRESINVSFTLTTRTTRPLVFSFEKLQVNNHFCLPHQEKDMTKMKVNFEIKREIFSNLKKQRGTMFPLNNY